MNRPDALYNLGAGRRLFRVVAEVLAILLRLRPRSLVLLEAIGYRLPRRVPGYQLVRDVSRPGRANIAVYVRKGLLQHRRWVDLQLTWDRTETDGTHPARSILRLRLNDEILLAAHAPPKTREGEGSSVPARREHADVLVALLRETNLPVLLLCDPNAAPTEPVGTAVIAHRIGGTYVDGIGNIEGVVARRLEVTAKFVRTVGGVRLGSDHGHALVVNSRKKEKT